MEPLHHLTLHQYFTQWLPERDHYAFPLRDLTYKVDFALSDALGFQTFWISNFVYFSVGLFFLLQLLRQLFPGRDRFHLIVLAAIAFHPLQVEVLQWASIRKHILVATFIAYGTLLVLRMKRGEIRTRTRGLFGVYVAGLLCWPTALLWIYWALYELRSTLLKNRARTAATALTAAAITGSYLHFVISQNSGYSLGATSAATASDWGRAFYFGWRTAGRMFFNAVFPIRTVIYYDEKSALNGIGLALLLIAAGFIARAIHAGWKTRKTEALLAVSFFGLFFALLLPQLSFITTNTEFVMADRYWHVPLPYLVLALAIWFGPILFSKPALQRPFAFTSVALLVAFVFLSAKETRYWVDDLSIIKRCSDVEGSSQCRALTIEKSFDKAGCPMAIQAILDGRTFYQKVHFDYWTNFSVDLPFYDAFCAATIQANPAIRAAAFAEVRALYPPSPAMMFSEVLVALSEGSVNQAYAIAEKSYLNPNYALKETNHKLINVLRGQAAFLCARLAGETAAACEKNKKRFEDRLAGLSPVKLAQVSWAYETSARAYSSAQ